MIGADFQAVGRPSPGPLRYVYGQAYAEDEILVLCRSKTRDRFEHGHIRVKAVDLTAAGTEEHP